MFMWESGWKEVQVFAMMGGMACGSTLDNDHNVVQIGSNNNTSSLILHCSLLHNHITVAPRLADDVS